MAEASASTSVHGASKPVRKTVPGLTNLGNTCFFNAILQALAGTELFSDYLSDVQQLSRAKRGPNVAFTHALQNCLTALSPVPEHYRGRCFRPSDLNSELRRRISSFKGSKQQDAQELLQFTLNIVSDEQEACRLQDLGLRDLIEYDGLEFAKSFPDFFSKLAYSMLPTSLPSDLFPLPHHLVSSTSSMTTSVTSSMADSISPSSSSIYDEFVLDEPSAQNPMRGLQVNLLRCTRCLGLRPVHLERFFDVTLSFRDAAAKKVTLAELLRAYTGSEMVQDVECSFCSVRQELHLTRSHYNEDERQLEAWRGKQQSVATEVPMASDTGIEFAQYRRLDWIEELKQMLDSGFAAHLDPRDRGIPVARTACQMQTQFARSPDVLCFHFNRKVLSNYSSTFRKVDTLVQFPLELDMSPYCGFAVGDDEAERTDSGFVEQLGARDRAERRGRVFASRMPKLHLQYVLKSVVMHHGTAGGGHFTAYRRTIESDQWFHVSDSKVREASLSEVLSSCAYMLFYERKHRPSGCIESEEELDVYGKEQR